MIYIHYEISYYIASALIEGTLKNTLLLLLPTPLLFHTGRCPALLGSAKWQQAACYVLLVSIYNAAVVGQLRKSERSGGGGTDTWACKRSEQVGVAKPPSLATHRD